jgi:hypothetical protein
MENRVFRRTDDDGRCDQCRNSVGCVVSHDDEAAANAYHESPRYCERCGAPMALLIIKEVLVTTRDEVNAASVAASEQTEKGLSQ